MQSRVACGAEVKMACKCGSLRCLQLEGQIFVDQFMGTVVKYIENKVCQTDVVLQIDMQTEQEAAHGLLYYRD